MMESLTSAPGSNVESNQMESNDRFQYPVGEDKTKGKNGRGISDERV